MFTPQLSKRRDGERVLLETGAEKNNAHVFVLSTTSMCVSASLFIHHLQSLYSMISHSSPVFAIKPIGAVLPPRSGSRVGSSDVLSLFWRK